MNQLWSLDYPVPFFSWTWTKNHTNYINTAAGLRQSTFPWLMDFSSQLPKPQRLHSSRWPELVPLPQTRLLVGLAWKGPLNVIYSPTLLGWAGTFFTLIRWLKAPSNLSFKHFQGSTTFLGNLLQHLSALPVENVILMPNPNLSIFSLKTLPCSLSLQASAKSSLSVPQCGVPWAFSSPGCTSPAVPACPHGFCVLCPFPVPFSGAL